MIQPLFAGLLLACLSAPNVSAAYFGGIYETSVYWHPPLELVEYESYRSVRLLEYVIPEASAEAWWDFKAIQLHQHCEVRNVTIYIQHGGYPVINPQNSTFPERFYLNRTKLTYLDLKTDNSSTPFVILNPLPGSWFASVLLLPGGRGHIGQKGLTGKSCSYGISATVVSTVRKDVVDISVSESPQLTLKATDSDKIYRYQLPGEVHHYTVTASNCTYSTSNSSQPCPFTLSVNTQVLADSSTSPTVIDCISHHIQECSLRVNSPAVNRWSYLQVMWSQRNVSHDSDVSFVLEFEMYGCQSFVGLSRSIAQAYPIRMKNSPRTGTVVYHYSQGTTKVLPSDSCHLMPTLGRLSMVKKDFTTAFVFSSPYFVPMPVNTRAIPDTMSLVTSFEIKHMIDTGGTLKLLLHTDPKHLASTQMAAVSMCAQKDFLPASIANLSEQVNCSQGVLLSVDSTGTNTTIAKRYIPYPESGIWFLTLSSRCFNKAAYNNGSSIVYEPCVEGGTPRAEFGVTVGQCVDGKCGSHGTCREYISGVYVFSSCDCSGGWRGYGCTDGSKADSLAEELLAVLLLTLSNLFFLPAVILGVYRRFFVEAMVYGFTMFFSTFYHACDLYGMFCMMNYNVLSYCDFYGSILSFWVTLLAMARLHPTVRSLFHMAGALGLALGVEYDRHGLWVFVTPVVCGVIVMAASWGRMCCGRRSLYPSWKRYLFFLLPGVVCAGTGLIIFAFVETTNNYKYTHSAWHAVMAISILFLLPPRRKQKGETSLEVPSQHVQDTVNLLPTDTINNGFDDVA